MDVDLRRWQAATYEGCHIGERILRDYSRLTGDFYTRHKIVKAVIARVTSKQDFGSLNRDNWGARLTRAFERKLIGKPCITPEEYETSFTTYARTAMKRDKQLGLFTKAQAPDTERATPDERLVEMSIYWNPDERIVRAIERDTGVTEHTLSKHYVGAFGEKFAGQRKTHIGWNSFFDNWARAGIAAWQGANPHASPYYKPGEEPREENEDEEIGAYNDEHRY